MRERSVALGGMKAHPLDLRQKILRAQGQRLGSQRAIAALFGVSRLSRSYSGVAGGLETLCPAYTQVAEGRSWAYVR
jgi:hypothetical protein